MANNIDWGKAHVNNSIGFGQGNLNNSIDWGRLYQRSLSGETILFFDQTFQLFKERVIDDGGTFEADQCLIDFLEATDITDAGVVLTPNGYKATELYSVKPDDGSGDFTVSRASTATRVNEDGLIETVGVNVPRLDYTDGGCPVILTEPQRTNLIPYSEDLSNVIWINRGFTKVGTSLGPMGSNAYEFLENNTDINPAIFYNGNVTDGTPRTLSVWLKASTPITIALATNSSVKTTNVSVTTEWSLFSCTDSVDTVLGTHIGGFGTITKGSGVTIYVAMPQQENGSYATSYIPTTGATATRLADNISLTTTGLGITSIIETIDGVEQTPITVIPTTYTLPLGKINNVIML